MNTPSESQIFEACRRLTVALPDGASMPRLGQGTWRMGERAARRGEELEALRLGAGLGMTLIDTAEMYGEGLSESLIGEAIRPLRRDDLFLVSKVYPHNAGRSRIFQSCENTLLRLGVERLDLYLLHWRGGVPLLETVDCMQQLVKQGKIARWGVSNFDADDMQELWDVTDGDKCCVNQVLYYLGSRGVEFDLLPWQRGRSVALMAYCPLAQGGRLRAGLLGNAAVQAAAKRHQATPAQVLLAFLLRDPLVVAIPKASSPAHARENAEAACLALTDEDVMALSAAFPAPRRKTPLDMQ